MAETILIVTLIVVLFLTTVISLFAMAKLRGRINSASDDNLDAGLDICMSELNKLGSLIKSDLDAKYKEILFLYNLIEERHKQIEALLSKYQTRASFYDAVDEASAMEVMPAYEELYDFGAPPKKILEPAHEPQAPMKNESESDLPRSSIPDHKVVLQMSERGLGVSDIAKELGIGQGEVRLILNIASK